MPLRKNVGSSISSTLRENAISFVFITIGLLDIVIQALLPDLVPEYINGLIERSQQSIWTGFLTFILYVWYLGGYRFLLWRYYCHFC